jgi:hypothetical protein
VHRARKVSNPNTIQFNSSFNMSAGPKHTRHFRTPCTLLYDAALMSAANMLLYLNPYTVAYVSFRHHIQFHQCNFSSSKSVRIKHNTNSYTYFPLFLIGECLILIPVIIIPFFSILCLTTHLIHQGHEKRKEIRDVSAFTAQHVRAALSVLHMAQKIYHVKSIICYLCFMLHA